MVVFCTTPLLDLTHLQMSCLLYACSFVSSHRLECRLSEESVVGKEREKGRIVRGEKRETGEEPTFSCEPHLECGCEAWRLHLFFSCDISRSSHRWKITQHEESNFSSWQPSFSGPSSSLGIKLFVQWSPDWVNLCSLGTKGGAWFFKLISWRAVNNRKWVWESSSFYSELTQFRALASLCLLSILRAKA